MLFIPLPPILDCVPSDLHLLSVATQMKGSGSRKTRPSKTEPGAEAWGENFNEINLEIQ